MTAIMVTRLRGTRVLLTAGDTGIGAQVWLGWYDGDPQHVQLSPYTDEGLAELIECLDRPHLRVVS